MNAERLTIIQYVHEAVFSLNLAFAVMAAVFLYAARSVTLPFFQMEIGIYKFLNMRSSDYLEGHWAFFLPGMALTIFFWALLRSFSRTRFAERVLHSLAGIAAIAVPPIFWLCATYTGYKRYGWSAFRTVQFYEILLVLFCVILYLRQQWPVPNWGSLVFLLLHYGFWLWTFGPHPFFMGYGGPVALLVGLCSSLAWGLYTQELWHAQARTERTTGIP